MTDNYDLAVKLRISIMNNLVMFSGKTLEASIIGAITSNTLESILHVLKKDGLINSHIMTDEEKKSLISYIHSALESVTKEQREVLHQSELSEERFKVSHYQLIERQLDGFKEAVTKIEKAILDYPGI